MKNILIGLISICFLCACTVGKDFVRPTDTTFELGKTTRQEILERLGDPMAEETSKGVPKKVGEGRGVELDPKIRDATFRYYRYSFVDRTKQVLLGTMSPAPFKELRLGFIEDKLYFYHFVTTFNIESKDFQEDSLNRIERGKTQIDEVRRMFGEPTGASIYPDTEYPD